MEKKQVIKIKERKKSKIENILDYLFKDVKFIPSMTSIIGVIAIIIFFKLFIIGVQQDLISGYFEIMVLGILLMILMFIVPFETEGWVGITNIVLLVGGVFYWLDSDYIGLYQFGLRLVCIFIAAHIIYKLLILFERK